MIYNTGKLSKRKVRTKTVVDNEPKENTQRNSKDSRSQPEINHVCKKKQVIQAISILRQINNKFYETSKKKPLFEDTSDKALYLQFTLKKIPPERAQKFIRVKLPNALVKESSEICLIVGDSDKRNHKAEIEPDILRCKTLLRLHGITQITEVLTLRQLRTEYKPFEAKRQLVNAYDVFLCDKKIYGVVPKLLGKTAFKQRKTPIQIDMNDIRRLKHHINSALSSTTFHITCRGNSFASQVASLGMKDEEIIANIAESIKIIEQIPGKRENILGIYLKAEKSKAIPLFMSYDSPNEVQFKFPRTQNAVATDEVSTLMRAKVKVFKDGKVLVQKADTGDSDEDESDEDADMVNKFIEEDKPKRKRTRSKKKKYKKIKLDKKEAEEIIPNSEEVKVEE